MVWGTSRGPESGILGGVTDGSEARLASRWAGVERRVPESLDEFRGPSSGVVQLPLRLAWSGLREFDLADEKLRLSLYRTLLNVGQRDDLVRYLNAGILVSDWPVLRKLVS
jgi:hypothetical protein